MNRTNRSGIILGAGPIGGYEQAGRWKLNVRFYRETMMDRVKWIAGHKHCITISNLDGVEFIRSFSASKARKTFFFVDPPYVQAGGKLYLNAMNEKKHRELGQTLDRKVSVEHWLMTYDDHPLVREIYATRAMRPLSVQYSLHRKRTESEIVISSY